ncbi:MAG: leucyl aminopeptidase, partial [Gemmatimonadota bacterium]
DGPAAREWQAATEGLLLGDWSFDELRDREAAGTREPPGRRVLWSEGAERPGEEARIAVRRGEILARAQNAARALVAQPGNIVTPRYLADHAERLGESRGLRVQAWGPEKLREAGFGGLLAVARGSAEEPRFVIIEHEGDGGAPTVVVGKGVTFDSGGISLKPSTGMEAMKYDMAGAAAVLGILRAAAELDVRPRIVGLVPTTENLPSGTALKPGDVIRGVSGKSIEVVNTDAEGRLILADALSYASRLGPRAIVDLATLTGGCVVALGQHAIGLLSPSDDLAAALEIAGRACGERAWRLPLWPEYRKQLESDIADLKNTGGRPAAPITAGSFLQAFVDDGVEWAHLDIAGTAWAEEAAGYQPKGATGIGVRLVLEWLRDAS